MKVPVVVRALGGAGRPHDGDDQCPECGAKLPGGRAGCQALWDELSANAYNDWRSAQLRDLGFDAYCMQHPETYCQSAKSYAAHLTRLCCGVENAGSQKVYAAIQAWLDGRVTLQKPLLPSNKGTLTVADLLGAQNGEEHERLLLGWAENVWKAYRGQHDLARLWIQAAIAKAESSAHGPRPV